MINEKRHPEYDKLLEVLRGLESWELVRLYIEAQTGIYVEEAEYYAELEDRINVCDDEISELVGRVKSKAVVQKLKDTLGTE